MKLPALLLLVTLLATPLACAVTLADFEEPTQGSDTGKAVFPFRVTADEADSVRILVYRNDPRTVFGLDILDSTGATRFTQNGTRGIQTFPPLPEGDYRAVVRRTGEFQITDKDLSKLAPLNTTLEGVDAYVFAPQRATNVTFTGNVTVEAWDLTKPIVTLTSGENITIAGRGAAVFTVRGTNATPYEVTLLEVAEPEVPTQDTPAPPLASVLGAVALAFLARRPSRR